MFTFNIRNIASAKKEGVKWAASPTISPDANKKTLQSQIVDIGKKSTDGIEFITKRQALLESASEDELKKLQELAIAKKAGKTPEYNEKLRQDIQKILDAKSAERTKATTATAEALRKNQPETKPLVDAAKAKLDK